MMAKPVFHIVIIDENALRAAILEEGLRGFGTSKITILTDTQHLVMRLQQLNPDVIVIDLENPKRDVLEQMFLVSRLVERPVAMFVDQSDSAMIEAAIDAGVSAYVVDGLKMERVKAVVDMAISRFNAYAKMQKQLQSTREELEDRKVIDRAKGLLMKAKGLDENTAYALLRSTAMKNNKRMAEIARSIITAHDLLGDGS
jgi:response regulator NasT